MGFFREDRFGGFSGLSYLSNLEKLHTVFRMLKQRDEREGMNWLLKSIKKPFLGFRKSIMS